MKRSIILAATAAAAAAAAACSGGAPDRIQPGQWEMVAKMTQFDAPGAPEAMLAPMRAQLNQEQTNQSCVTPEQAANPLREFREVMTRGQPGATCQTTDDVFAGGVIRVRATCRAASGQPGSGQMSMEGSFTATTLEANLTVNAEGPSPTGQGTQAVRMTTQIRGRRTGDCPAGSRPANSQ